MATTEELLCPLPAGGGWPGLGPASSCPGMATGMLGPLGQGLEVEAFCFHKQPPGLWALSVRLCQVAMPHSHPCCTCILNLSTTMSPVSVAS